MLLMLMAAEVVLMGHFRKITLLDHTTASCNLKGQKSLVCNVALFVPIKLVFVFLCKSHCSVTQCQLVSETCLSNSDNRKFQQHKYDTLVFGPLNVKLGTFLGCISVLHYS